MNSATVIPDETQEDALWEALSHVPKERKAEIRGGQIVLLPMTGDMPGIAADEIAFSLRNYARETGRGLAVGDNRAFRARLPHRGSFSPDAAYYTGPRGGMKYYPQPPVFAVEVRSEFDYGPAAEREMEAKREDYFAAGTLVVWDVDLQSDTIVRVFKDGDAHLPAAAYGRGGVADAEPAVPGWRMPVKLVFGAE